MFFASNQMVVKKLLGRGVFQFWKEAFLFGGGGLVLYCNAYNACISVYFLIQYIDKSRCCDHMIDGVKIRVLGKPMLSVRNLQWI